MMIIHCNLYVIILLLEYIKDADRHELPVGKYCYVTELFVQQDVVSRGFNLACRRSFTRGDFHNRFEMQRLGG